MRRQQLEQAVRELVTSVFHDAPDVAEAILADDAFGALVGKLRQVTDGDRNEMDRELIAVYGDLEDDTLDWLAEDADNPAAYIASRI